MTKKKKIIIVVLILIFIGAIIDVMNDEDMQPSNQPASKNNGTSKTKHISNNTSNVSNKSSHPTREGVKEKSNLDVKDLDILFSDNIRNDVTGNLRLATFSESVDFKKYVLSYCKEYFKNEKEVHMIVNFTNKVTIKINDVGDRYSVSTFEHVKGEEHDAKTIPSGMKLGECNVYKDNGDIEVVE